MSFIAKIFMFKHQQITNAHKSDFRVSLDSVIVIDQ